MISTLELLGMAFLLGFVFNATPGAVFAETIRHSLSGGYRAALSVQFGSLVGDAVWAVLGLAGIGLLLQAESLKIPVGVGALGISNPDSVDYTLFFFGFMGSSLVWCFVCAGLVSRMFGGRGGAWRVWTYRICAIAFAYLALGTGREVMTLLFPAG